MLFLLLYVTNYFAVQTFNLVTIIMLMTRFKHSKLHKLLSLHANINWLLTISGTVWEMYFPKKVILCEVKRTKVNTQTLFPKTYNYKMNLLWKVPSVMIRPSTCHLINHEDWKPFSSRRLERNLCSHDI
jgi:hypothetical protein